MSQGFVNSTNIPLPLAVQSGGTGVTSSTGTGSVVLNNAPNLIGVTNGSNAAAGSYGEYFESIVLAPGIAIATAVATNLTSILLQPGDYNAWGNIGFSGGTTNQVAAWVSSTSATIPNAAFYNIESVTGAIQQGLSAPQQRFSITVPTTIYLSGVVSIVTGTYTFFGGLYIRRIR